MSMGAAAALQRETARRRPFARAGVVLAALAGLTLAVVVVGWFGIGRIVASLEAVSWRGFLLYAAYSLLTFAITGAAWWALARGEGIGCLPAYVFGRLLREAASDILPFSSVGGVVAGARGATLRGADPETAYAALALDLVTEMVAQVLFLALGLALLSAHLTRSADARAFTLCFAVAAVVALVVITALVVAQRRGFGLLDRIAERFAPAAVAKVQGVRGRIAELHRRPLRLLASVALHEGGWIASAVGSWIALRLMGVGLSIPAVIAIEGLLSAVKSAAFVVPNAVGVQEAAYALVGQVFGLSGEMGVALSLLRRAKDLAIGLPTLIAWQGMEGRRLFRRRPVRLEPNRQDGLRDLGCPELARPEPGGATKS